MEGGTKNISYGAARPAAVCFAFENIVIPLIRTTQECGFCRFLIRFTVKRILKVRKNMLHFIIGVFVGSFVGVLFMCLV